jgi:hypothetical protein
VVLTLACGAGAKARSPVHDGAAADLAIASSPCSLEAQVVATLDTAALDLAVDDAHVYFARVGGVWRLAKQGGALGQVISAGESYVSQLYLRGGDVYWIWPASAGPLATLRKSSKDGGRSAVLAEGPALRLLEVDGPDVYFVSQTFDGAGSGSLAVEAVAPDGSGRRTLGTGTLGRWIFADLRAVYWVEGYGDAAVTRVLSLSGGPPRVWKEGSYRLVASDADSVYAMKFLPSATAAERWRLLRMATDGSTEQELTIIDDPNDGADYRFARDGEYLYWADESAQVWRIPAAGGPRIALGTGRAFDVDDEVPPLMVAVDRDSVYWQVAPPGTEVGKYSPGPMLLARACK